MKDWLRGAWLDLRRKRLRSWLAIGGIAIGTALVILVSGIGGVGRQAVTAELESMGIDGLSVSAASGLTVSCLHTIRSLPMVAKAMPLLLEYAGVRLKGEDYSVMGCGIDAGADQVISLQLLHGRLLTTGDVKGESAVCVVDETLAREAYGRSNIVGKKLSFSPKNGEKIELTVIGVTATGSSLLQSVTSLIPYMIYLPYTTLQAATDTDTFDQIAVRVSSAETEKAAAAIRRSLSYAGEDVGKLSTEDLSTQRARLDRLMDILTLALTAIGGVSLVVSGCGIMTVMLSSVQERTGEIGIKKAIGATRGRILAEFLSAAVLMSTIGAFSGLFLGGGLLIIGSRVWGYDMVWQPVSWAIICGITVLLGTVFGAYPAYQAAGLQPVEALRQET